MCAVFVSGFWFACFSLFAIGCNCSGPAQRLPAEPGETADTGQERTQRQRGSKKSGGLHLPKLCIALSVVRRFASVGAGSLVCPLCAALTPSLPVCCCLPATGKFRHISGLTTLNRRTDSTLHLCTLSVSPGLQPCARRTVRKSWFPFSELAAAATAV
jgi:hypothetical protein